MNLHCRKLTDFRWYKDNYLVKVFSIPDCKESYWKERFIAGLPKLFAERFVLILGLKKNSKKIELTVKMNWEIFANNMVISP
uniref:Uncharacterized protein n=1 Tax=Lactuca sativa TaxID=4236 RepID=A0A9R1X1D4_LACSA|nr:hypothetical protein LSAT_V11C700382530 [Lactuca sativa]